MKRSQEKALDKLWSEAVKVKANYRCEYCGRRGYLNSCHIVGRRFRATRWGAWINGEYDLCGFCGCFTCHNQYDEHGPNEHRIIEKVIGVARKVFIQNTADRTIAKNLDFESIKKELEKICKCSSGSR